MVSLVVSLRVGSVEGDRARPGFSGRPGVPSGGQTAPGDGSRRGWEAGGGAAASWPSSAISGITNGIISGITKGGERGQDRARPGFSGRLRGKEPCQVPDPGDSLKTPSWSTRQGSTAFRGFLRIRRTRPGRVRYAAGWVKGEGDPFGRVLAGRGWAVTRRRRASPAGMKFLEGFGLRGRDRRTAAGPPAWGESLWPRGAKAAPSRQFPVHGPGTPRLPAPPNALPVFLGPGVSGNLPGRRIGAGRERPDGTPRRCGRRPDPEGPSRRSPGFPDKEGAGEADMRGEGRKAGKPFPGGMGVKPEAFCGRVESRRQSGTRPQGRIEPPAALSGLLAGPGKGARPGGTLPGRGGPASGGAAGRARRASGRRRKFGSGGRRLRIRRPGSVRRPPGSCRRRCEEARFHRPL